MARYWKTSDPFNVRAVCGREQAERLVQYDHHQVQVNGCWGILITYHWMPLETAPDPLLAIVHFNPAPRHTKSEDQIRIMIRKHPPAPPEIQDIVDGLRFDPGAQDQ